MDYNKIKLLSTNVVNVKLCSDLAIPENTGAILEAATNSLSGAARTIFNSLVTTGGISTVAKKLGNQGLSAMGNMSTDSNAALTSLMAENPKLLSMLAGINVLAGLLTGDANKANTCAAIKELKSAFEALSQINYNLRSEFKIDPTPLNIDQSIYASVVSLSPSEFIKLNSISLEQKNSIGALPSTDEFNFFNDTPSASLVSISSMPLNVIHDNQSFASDLTELDDEDRSLLLSYLSAYSSQQFINLLNMLSVISAGDHLLMAQYADVPAMSGLIGVQIDLGQLTSDMQPVIVIFSQVPNDIRSNILGLNKTVFSELSAEFNNTEIRQLVSMSPHTWNWFHDYVVDITQSLWEGPTAITKDILTALLSIDYANITSYRGVRATTDSTNLLNVFSSSTINEICDQRLYRDLSIFSGFGDMAICQAFLDYGDDRFLIDDSTLNDNAALALLLGVDESIFVGTNWLAIKSMCVMSLTSLTQINSLANVNNMRALSFYSLSTLRGISASAAGDYLLSLTNINLENIYSCLYQPTVDIPSAKLRVAPAADLILLSDEFFSVWQSVLGIDQTAKSSLAAQTTDAEYTSLIIFFNLVDVSDLALIGGLEASVYLDFKTITKLQYDAIYNLLDLDAPTFSDLLNTPANIDNYMGILNTTTPGLLLALYKIREAFSELLNISKENLIELFAIEDTNSLILYLKFIEFCNNSSMSNYSGLKQVFSSLTMIDNKYKTLIFPSYYLNFVNSLSLAQLQHVDNLAATTLANNNIYDCVVSSVFDRINLLADSEIDSLGEIEDSIIDLLIADFSIIDRIALHDYSDFLLSNGGPFTEEHIAKFKLIMEG